MMGAKCPVDDSFSRLEERGGSERGWCAPISSTFASSGPQEAQTAVAAGLDLDPGARGIPQATALGDTKRLTGKVASSYTPLHRQRVLISSCVLAVVWDRLRSS
jgi:hypothetical protein